MKLIVNHIMWKNNNLMLKEKENINYIIIFKLLYICLICLSWWLLI